jgi:VIT1/CCC1 family predicted Fe2+/Mn2+ transporter
MFGSFLPILSYLAVKAGGMISSVTAILIAIVISVISSFIVGALKGRMAKKSWIKGGIEMAGLGTGLHWLVMASDQNLQVLEL